MSPRSGCGLQASWSSPEALRPRLPSPAPPLPRPSQLKFPQASGAAGAWFCVPGWNSAARAGGTLVGLLCGAKEVSVHPLSPPQVAMSSGAGSRRPREPPEHELQRRREQKRRRHDAQQLQQLKHLESL